jgi:hypothetical protein
VRLLPGAAVLLAGCASTVPAPARLPAGANDSCRVRTWSLAAKGMDLPRTPTTLQTEQESDHLAGTLLGDWGRPLASFHVDGDRFGIDRSWFSGVGLSPQELVGMSLGLADPGALVSALGEGWSLAGIDSCRTFRFRGKDRMVRDSAALQRRTLRDPAGTWLLEATLVQEESQAPGSCRGP